MFRKMTCMLLALVLLCAMAVPASAVSGSEAKSAYDLEAYMNLNTRGLIDFDAQAAIADGFPSNMVAKVQSQINFMNSLVLDGVTTINEDYTATVYRGRSSPSPEDNDITYVQYDPWGYTVYYSVADTERIVQNLPSDERLIEIQQLFDESGILVNVTVWGIVVNVMTLRQVAGNGTGIYIQIYNDGTTSTPLCFVGPRPESTSSARTFDQLRKAMISQQVQIRRKDDGME